MAMAWERAIPLWPWTIVPYWSIDLLYGVSLFLCASRAELNAHAKRLLAVTLLSCLCFLLFPLRFGFERPPLDGVFGRMFDLLMGFDKPFNQAPSLHIGLLLVLWLRYWQHTPPRWLWLLHGWFALIGVSVLTTWQHHFWMCLPASRWRCWSAICGRCRRRQRRPGIRPSPAAAAGWARVMRRAPRCCWHWRRRWVLGAGCWPGRHWPWAC